MTKYLKAILHINGEKQEFTNPIDAERVRNAFHANYLFNHDGSKELGISEVYSAFIELDVDKTAIVLASKTNCDNYD